MNFGHGGNIDEVSRLYGIEKDQIIDFSSNINPLGLHENVRNAMIQGICEVDKYPDITYKSLIDAISEYEGVNHKNIVLGNGAGEVIFNIVRAIMPRNGLVFAPSFSEYSDALEGVNCKVHHFYYGKDFSFDLSVLDMVEGMDIVFLCNPNNPTGGLTLRGNVISLAEKCRDLGATLVVDESFLDFVEDSEEYSMISSIAEFNNVVVVKSLTKFYAFPGIRIGYGITSNSSYIEGYKRVCPPWNVNIVAMNGAIAALKESEYADETIRYIRDEGIRLYSELGNIDGIKPYPPSVNYVLFKCLVNREIREELIKKGILIRDCSNYEGLESGYYRVAVKRESENNLLVAALKEVLK
ncbi:MAG: threonine-phosphate decarboxylase CobD [Clostridium sp.]